MAASLDKSSVPLPAHDIFGTPENEVFLSTNPYSALAKNKKEIRLLQVLPEDQEGMIACTLQQSRPLSEVQGPYVALSYCAGDPLNTKQIIVNGTVCNVFANLEHALDEVRYFWKQTHTDEDPFMWVDQICINQMDLGERSHQVGFMRDIYEKSRQVLVCLSIKPGSARGMKWLQRVMDEVQILEDDPNGADLAFGWTLLNERLREATKNNEEYVEEWSAFWDVVKSPWWTRAWIFQEFIVAPSAIFIHSHQHVTWERLHSAMSVLIRFQSANDNHFYHVHRMMQPQESNSAPALEMVASLTEQKAQWTGVQDLTTLLLRSRKTSASNLRDKIYAVIGLADPGYNIVPNYKKSLNEVLIETTRRIIEFENSLRVLQCTYEPSQNVHMPSSVNQNVHWSSWLVNLPSWVIDWAQPGRVEDFISQRSFSSPGNAALKIGFQIVTGGSLALLVWGAYYGSVCDVKKLWRPVGDIISPEYEAFVCSQNKYTMPFECRTGVEDEDELWTLQGLTAAVILRRSVNGYRLISLAFPRSIFKQDWSIAQSDTRELQRISIV